MRLLPSLIIVKRELVTNLRRVRTLLLVVALTGVAGGVVLAMWPQSNIPSTMAGSLSQSMLTMLSLTLFYGCILFVPGLAAATVVSEREQETLDSLYLTLVRPAGMVAAKAVNTVGVYLLLVVGTFPVFATVMFGVGLDWNQLFYTLILLTSTALCCSMVGILCSTYFRRTFPALLAAYTATVFFMGAPSYLLRFVGLFIGPVFRSPGAVRFMTPTVSGSISPLGTLLAIQLRGLSAHQLATVVGWQLFFCLVLFLLANRFLRRQTQPRAVSGEKSIADPTLLRARRNHFPYYLIDPLRRKPLIEDGRNPMLVREMRWGLFNRGTVLVRIFYSVFTVSMFGALGVSVTAGSRVNTEIAAWYAMQMGLLVCLASILAANSFSKEYELGNMDMLRMTQLHPAAVVFGKYAASLLSLVPILLAMIISSIPILVWQRQATQAVFAGFFNLLVCALLSTATGCMVSLLTRRTNLSLVGGMAANLMLFAGLALAVTVIRDRETWSLSPIFAYMDAFAGRGRSRYESWFVLEMIYLGIAAGLLGYTTHVLRTRRMQDP